MNTKAGRPANGPRPNPKILRCILLLILTHNYVRRSGTRGRSRR